MEHRDDPIYKELADDGACDEGLGWLRTLPLPLRWRQIWNECPHPAWLLYLCASERNDLSDYEYSELENKGNAACADAMRRIIDKSRRPTAIKQKAVEQYRLALCETGWAITEHLVFTMLILRYAWLDKTYVVVPPWKRYAYNEQVEKTCKPLCDAIRNVLPPLDFEEQS